MGRIERQRARRQCHQSNGKHESWEKKYNLYSQITIQEPSCGPLFFEKTTGLSIEAGLCVQLCS